MNEMLTAKELQELFQGDRSTIYRMADSGQLLAIKVGKQWRFPAGLVEKWFNLRIPEASLSPEKSAHTTLSESQENLASLLPAECIQLVQDTFAELLGVMLVVTDMEGNPITEPSNACGMFESISHVPHAVQRCIQSWHELGTTLALEPKFKKSHLGLMCAGSLVRVGTELKGMVVGGCIAPDEWPPTDHEIREMAASLGVDQRLLEAHLGEVHFIDKAFQQTLLVYLQRIAHIVSHIVNERNSLVSRLTAIADLTAL